MTLNYSAMCGNHIGLNNIRITGTKLFRTDMMIRTAVLEARCLRTVSESLGQQGNMTLSWPQSRSELPVSLFWEGLIDGG